MIKKTLFLLLAVFAFAGIKNIKNELSNTKIIISKMNTKLDRLAKKINQKQTEINTLNNKIKNVKQQIENLTVQLKNSNQKLNSLFDLKKGYQHQYNDIQQSINDFLSTNYYISTSQADNINDLVHQEVTKKILKIYSKKIASLASQQKNIKNEINDTARKIKTIIDRQKLYTQKIKELTQLKKKRQKELNELSKQKILYKKRLYAIIKRQQYLQNKLKELAIIKTTKHKYNNTNINYKYRTKIYRGVKTIPPLLGKVTKRFGSYIDPVYRIRVYNDTINIKPYQKNSIVRAIMSGRIVYIDKKKGIIFIRHKNNLFSIYANLSMVSPLLKKGSYVKRGQIIARVADYLEFEITYKDRPINPLKVISLK